MLIMSWPNNWPPMQHPSWVPAYPPPIPGVTPLPSTSAVPDYAALNADQYKQWQQYHVQYAEWHAQYGEQYARETGKSLPPVASSALQMQPTATIHANPYVAAPVAVGTSFASLNLVAPPPPAEPHPDELNLTEGQDKPPLPEDKSAEELAFDEQFRKWEQEFETWKRKNRNHPDKVAYRDYEQKCMECRKKLLERREQLRQKRIEQRAAARKLSSGTVQHSYNPPQPTESAVPPPHSGLPDGSSDEESNVDVSQRKYASNDSSRDKNLRLENVFSHSAANGDGNGGIPGLDLIDEHPPPVPKKIKLEENVGKVIDLADNEDEVKPAVGELNDTANAISSLLNDPKVNALLQLVGSTMTNSSGNGTNAGGSGSNMRGTNPLVAALAQLTNSRTGSFEFEKQNQNITEIRSNGAVEQNVERAKVVQPQRSTSPVSRCLFDEGSSIRTIQDFNPRIPPPSLNIDLSRPPPSIQTNKRQQQDRWNTDPDQQMQNESFVTSFSVDGIPLAKVARFDRPPPTLESRDVEYHIDPELGRPVAVPKPDWMTEEEYQEIYDRYEHVRSFEERKNKMELAIHVLRQSKIRDGKVGSGEASNRLRGSMPKPLPNVKVEINSEQANEFFQPQQVFDYTNCRSSPTASVNPQSHAGRVIDYGHCAAGQYNPSNANNRFSNRQDRLRSNPNTGTGHEFGSNTQCFDYNHSRATSIAPKAPTREEQTQHWPLEKQPSAFDRSVPGLERLAQMHLNPNPEESNPNYPSKFLLMNDNRPNCLSTKRGKRPSSIRKQKLKQQLQRQQQNNLPNSQQNEHEPSTTKAIICKQEPALELEDLSSDDDTVDDRPDDGNTPDDSVKQEQQDERPESAVSSQSSQNNSAARMVDIEDLLFPPGRYTRPPRICLIVRGLPGSGKSFLARLIKQKEQVFGPSPRVLSLDDYFLIDKEEEERDPLTGKLNKVTRSEYEFDGEMEEIYIQNLLKAFKRTISERLFNFVIVDCCNHRLEYYCEFHNFARSNGFKVYTCTMQTDVDVCARQNIHNRTVAEIQAYANSWAMAPDEHVQINFNGLLQSNELDTDKTVADMEITAADEEPNAELSRNLLEHTNTAHDKGNVDSADSSAECDLFASKWDNDASEQNLARLDGTSKPLKRPPTIEDYLQLDDMGDDDDAGLDRKKKRVRWADVEERKAQKKMRQMGFVVGVTDWSRMMDPTQGSSALTQTKYIARVKKQP